MQRRKPGRSGRNASCGRGLAFAKSYGAARTWVGLCMLSACHFHPRCLSVSRMYCVGRTSAEMVDNLAASTRDRARLDWPRLGKSILFQTTSMGARSMSVTFQHPRQTTVWYANDTQHQRSTFKHPWPHPGSRHSLVGLPRQIPTTAVRAAVMNTSFVYQSCPLRKQVVQGFRRLTNTR